MLKNSFWALLILLAFACNRSSSSSPEYHNLESIVTEFEKQLQKDLKDDDIEGSISAAIFKKDKIIWSRAFGFSDRATKTPADTGTIYRTGSISKSFTAFLMMQLVEDEVIKLTDPIELYLPEIKNLIGYSEATKITFRQLSTHTSGLIREPDLEGAASGPIEHWEDKILQSIHKTRFESQPGEKFSYSNIGYGILGLALSRAADKPFMDLVKEKIFVPLNMRNSYFKIPDAMVSKLAVGMNGGPGKIDIEKPKLEHSGRGYKVPNGGIYATPNDLTKFAMSNMGYHALLTPEDLQLMQTPESESGYGLGFFISRDDQAIIVEHDGAVAGYTAQLAFEKTSKHGVIIMRNYNEGASDLMKLSHDLLMKLTELDNGTINKE